MTTNLLCGATVTLALAASTAFAVLPSPIYSTDVSNSNVSFENTAISPNHFSIAFWAKFDKLPSVGSPTGLFDCSVNKDGILQVRLSAMPTEYQGDYVIKSKDLVKRGEWVHVELVYTLQQTRAALYLNGKLQWENDNLFLPHLRFAGSVAPVSFKGAVRDLVIYDTALPNEYLAIAENVKESCDSISKILEEAAKTSKSGILTSWIRSLEKATADYLQNSATITMAAIAELQRNAENALTFAKESTKSAMASRSMALYTVPPVGQEIFLPYSIPQTGKVENEMRIVLSPGEYENGSVVAFAYAPMTVKNIVVSNLKGPNGKTIEGKTVDVKLVKRWFRSGGAWLSYHNDFRQRNLTPDLLVNDDALIKVDEIRLKNYLRLNYPEGIIYADVSDTEKGHISWDNGVPFQDATTLQPHEIPEAGRNQQYLFTFHAAEGTDPGIYRGSISFQTSIGNIDLPVLLRVLPIELPIEPSPYANLDDVYITHMNHLATGATGATLEKRRAYMKSQLANIRAHNMFHTTRIWNTPELAKLSFEVGFIPDKIFSDQGRPENWRKSFFRGSKSADLTSKDKEAGVRASIRAVSPWTEFFTKTFPKTAEKYSIYYSESTAYDALNNEQAEEAYVAHKLGQKVFAHTMSEKNIDFMGDIQDMTSDTSISAENASAWHAVGGEVINYANPFPGSENPAWYRRKNGFLMYKLGLDGQMLHGWRQGRTPWNEFALDKGGDGDYRNFCMSYPMRDGIIYTLAWEGVREAYDDLRYLTRLRQLSSANLKAESDELRREAKRAALWIERLSAEKSSLDMIRMGTISRILTLQDSIRRNNGVMPNANQAIRK